ncbi:hypothetical protein ACFQE5_18820 [Pseudonocardia hispaniensis]|uniref:LSD1 subclass zinc finger protein n=1 Tax=Pseudonocardia hispaniensis TaxID=904933 RepID=A0ABW1J6H5_9PSEU
MTTPTCDAYTPQVVQLADSTYRLIRAGHAGQTVLAETQRQLPVALRDQIDAATADTDRANQRLATLTGYRYLTDAAATLPKWIVLALLRALAAWQVGTASTCMHNPHPDRPRPVMAAAWRPGTVACTACTLLLTCRPGSTADRTCDGCGHITTGPEHHDGIRPVCVSAGPMTLMAGVCEHCRWWPADTSEGTP